MVDSVIHKIHILTYILTGLESSLKTLFPTKLIFADKIDQTSRKTTIDQARVLIVSNIRTDLLDDERSALVFRETVVLALLTFDSSSNHF